MYLRLTCPMEARKAALARWPISAGAEEAQCWFLTAFGSHALSPARKSLTALSAAELALGADDCAQFASPVYPRMQYGDVFGDLADGRSAGHLGGQLGVCGQQLGCCLFGLAPLPPGSCDVGVHPRATFGGGELPGMQIPGGVQGCAGIAERPVRWLPCCETRRGPVTAPGTWTG